MDREALRDEVRAIVRRDTTQMTTALLNSMIDWSQRKAANLHTFEEMRKIYTSATVADQKRYNFPDDMKDIYSLRLLDAANSRKLVYVNARDFDAGTPRPETFATGRPSHYVDYGEHFQLQLIPNDAYDLEMRCSIYPPAMTADDEDPLLANKDLMLIAGACHAGYAFLQEDELAEYWMAQFRREHADALAGEHSAEDWIAIPRGFSLLADKSTSDPSNPF